MVAPIAIGLAAVGAASYGLYRAGKSRGIKKGKESKEEELSQEVKEEIKQELWEDAEEEFEKEKSEKAHQQAQSRAPPVSIGDSVRLGVKEFRTHHSGKKTAVCKKEGFVIFVEDCPAHLSEGSQIRADITSFGRNKTSAEAKYNSTI